LRFRNRECRLTRMTADPHGIDRAIERLEQIAEKNRKQKHEQDRRIGPSASEGLAFADPFYSISGSQMLTLSPPSCLLDKLSLPRCASTISRLMVKPNPVPEDFVE